MNKGGWVYIMTNASFGTLYTGVTTDLAGRVTQHREGNGSGFCKKWNLTRLVYAEPFGDIINHLATLSMQSQEKSSSRNGIETGR